jgi:hypothetical protein
MHKVYCILLFTTAICIIHCKKFKNEDKPAWAKKDIRDYNDADLERLLEQWEVNLLRFTKKNKGVTIM